VFSWGKNLGGEEGCRQIFFLKSFKRGQFEVKGKGRGVSKGWRGGSCSRRVVLKGRVGIGRLAGETSFSHQRGKGRERSPLLMREKGGTETERKHGAVKKVVN